MHYRPTKHYRYASPTGLFVCWSNSFATLQLTPVFQARLAVSKRLAILPSFGYGLTQWAYSFPASKAKTIFLSRTHGRSLAPQTRRRHYFRCCAQ
jgi:hypothetical protein